METLNNINHTQLIIELLRYNTGTHFMDSGGDNGRQWQRNKEKEFVNEPRISYEYYDNKLEYISVNLFHYLNDITELNEKAIEINEYINIFNKECIENNEQDNTIHWTGELLDSSILEYFEAENVTESLNTYNHENNISQNVQYFTFRIEDEIYIALQIHGGADIRGGYTPIRVFKLNELFSGYVEVFGHVNGISIDNMYNGYSLTNEDGEEIEILESQKIELERHEQEIENFIYLYE